ncbi:unnamed protein product [Trichogramma brassicae]|uniref:Uncharacterized protein n=1 Tax=Trichogramma brassicae TaxID=86971 RepID=A0A6H5IGF5_9HYME|nr:unnamed protein product [Trichogramma brassicae]
MRQRVVNPARSIRRRTWIDTGVLSRRLREDLLAEQRQRRARGLQVAARQVSASQSRPQPVLSEKKC